MNLPVSLPFSVYGKFLLSYMWLPARCSFPTTVPSCTICRPPASQKPKKNFSLFRINEILTLMYVAKKNYSERINLRRNIINAVELKNFFHLIYSSNSKLCLTCVLQLFFVKNFKNFFISSSILHITYIHRTIFFFFFFFRLF